jgi:hypothetical protein
MSSIDLVPHKDADLLAFTKNLTSNLEKNGHLWNVRPDSYAKIAAFIIAFAEALAKLEDPNHGKVDVALKNNIKKDGTKEIRAFLKESIIYNRLISKDALLAMGLKPHDDVLTRPSKPTDMGIGDVDTSTHQQHTVRVKAGNLTGKSKPDITVTGFELQRKVGGEPPKTDEEWTYVDFSSRSALIVKYPLADVGKIVYYRFRWVNTRNEKGPWCESYLMAVVP